MSVNIYSHLKLNIFKLYRNLNSNLGVVNRKVLPVKKTGCIYCGLFFLGYLVLLINF